MIIALDYDGTYTEDPILWHSFIMNVLRRKHKVMMVTMRNAKHDYHEDHAHLEETYGIEIHFCDGQPKRKFMEDQGIKIDVWIDDMPEGIIEGSKYTPVQLEAWREAQAAEAFKKNQIELDV